MVSHEDRPSRQSYEPGFRRLALPGARSVPYDVRPCRMHWRQSEWCCHELDRRQAERLSHAGRSVAAERISRQRAARSPPLA